MLTVIETPTFSRLAADYWTEDERGAFAAFIASHPEAGNVVPGSGGCAKCVGHVKAPVSAAVCVLFTTTV